MGGGEFAHDPLFLQPFFVRELALVGRDAPDPPLGYGVSELREHPGVERDTPVIPLELRDDDLCGPRRGVTDDPSGLSSPGFPEQALSLPEDPIGG